MSLRLGVLLSGSGTNLQSIIDRIEDNTLNAKIECVVSNVSDAYGLQRAKDHAIDYAVVQSKDFTSREEHDQAVSDLLQEQGVEAVILAGYMRLLSKGLIQDFPGKILNIHPSLLPSFKGTQAQKQAADFGVKISGATVHFVDEYLDNGPVIIQGALPAFSAEKAEDLSARILQIEHRIYPQAIQWLATDRLRINNGYVQVSGKDCQEEKKIFQEQFLINPPLEEGF